MTSNINPSVIVDGLPVSKAAVRAQLAAARDEITELQRMRTVTTTQVTSAAYAVTYGHSLTYTDGMIFRIRLNAAASPSAPTVTLNVNNLGAVAIRQWNGKTLVDVPGRQFVVGSVLTLIYNSSVPCFMLISSTHPPVGRSEYAAINVSSVTSWSITDLPTVPSIDIEIDAFTVATAGQQLVLRVSTDNGATYLNTGYAYSAQRLNDTSSAYVGDSSADGWPLTGACAIVTPPFFQLSARVFLANTTNGAHGIQWKAHAPHATTTWETRIGVGHRSSPTPINALRLLMSGGAQFTMSGRVLL
jgi:hypothetical protein